MIHGNFGVFLSVKIGGHSVIDEDVLVPHFSICLCCIGSEWILPLRDASQLSPNHRPRSGVWEYFVQKWVAVAVTKCVTCCAVMLSSSRDNLRLHMKEIHDRDISKEDSILSENFIQTSDPESSGKCLKCGKVLKLGKSAATTSLREHMKRIHGILVPTVPKKNRLNKLFMIL